MGSSSKCLNLFSALAPPRRSCGPCSHMMAYFQLITSQPVIKRTAVFLGEGEPLSHRELSAAPLRDFLCFLMDVVTSGHPCLKVRRIIGVVNHQNILPGEYGRAGDRETASEGGRGRGREREANGIYRTEPKVSHLVKFTSRRPRMFLLHLVQEPQEFTNMAGATTENGGGTHNLLNVQLVGRNVLKSRLSRVVTG